MSLQVVKFKTEYKGGSPVDWVEIAANGIAYDKCRTWLRVEKMRPSEDVAEDDRGSASYMAMVSRWNDVEPHYDAWKNGEELPETGTPLAAWAGVSPDQARHLRSIRIKSVEDVRGMDEKTMASLPFPNARQMPGLAAAFLEGKVGADKDAEMAEMREMLETMQAALNENAAAKAKAKPAPKIKAAA